METPSVIRPAFLPPSSGLQELGGRGAADTSGAPRSGGSRRLRGCAGRWRRYECHRHTDHADRDLFIGFCCFSSATGTAMFRVMRRMFRL